MTRLEEVEWLRYERPVESVALAQELLEEAESLEEALKLACELGHGMRACGRLAESSQYLNETTKIASSAGFKSIVSDALWRLAWTHVFEGRLLLARRVSTTSILCGVEADARQQIGLALIAKAASHHFLGEYQISQKLLFSADPYLTRRLDRAALAINIYNNSRKMGSFSKLELDFDPSELPSSMKADLLWIEAHHAGPTDACRILDTLLSHHLANEDWIFSALAAAEAAVILCELGKPEGVRRIAKKVQPVVMKLERNPLAEGATAKLVTAALCGHAELQSTAILSRAALRKARENLVSLAARQTHLHRKSSPQ